MTGMRGKDHAEVERKFAVDESDQLPALTMIPGVDTVRTIEDQMLDAVYFDTPSLTLAARHITLRRRTGGRDAGWHLKLPLASDERREITEPLREDPDTVPPRLKSLVLVHIRNQKLVPVAHLKTRRTVISLISSKGRVLAEFCDDRVESTVLLEPVVNSTWREWEIELVDGQPKLLAAATAVFFRTGVRPAESPSKLARALAARNPAGRPRLPQPRRKGPASAVLLSYLMEQVEALKTQDLGVRGGNHDAVHQLRVAARRIRSVLASFSAFTDKATAKHLRNELQWLATSVGTGRDLEVMRSRLNEAINQEPPALVTGQVRENFERQLRKAYDIALVDGQAVLDSNRYFGLLDSLDGFLETPPLTGKAHKKAPARIGRIVNGERRRLKRNVKRISSGVEDEPLNEVLHEVRKSAKRLRYAAEASAPVLGRRAVRIARTAEELQTILGEYQDSVVIRE